MSRDKNYVYYSRDIATLMLHYLYFLRTFDLHTENFPRMYIGTYTKVVSIDYRPLRD